MVETSLLEAAISFGVYEAAHYSTHRTRPDRIGQMHRGSAPYQCLAAADGYMIVGAAQQAFWVNFVDIIGRAELKDDPRFKTNANRVSNNSVLIAIIEKELIKPKAYWLAELERPKSRADRCSTTTRSSPIGTCWNATCTSPPST